MSSAQTVNAFLKQYLEDQWSGRRRTLDQYFELFPGADPAIAEQYARLESEAAERPSPAPVERIGPYRVLEEVGRGGQGIVYLAEDDRLHRTVALKVLTGLGSLAPGRVARFLREAEVASRLDHPGIATVYEIGTAGGVPFIAMRFVEGETLAARIIRESASGDRGDAESVKRSAGIAEKAARALHVAHELGIIHRDIKPGNILVQKDGMPVVVDFGLAHDSDSDLATLTRTGEFFGTPAYMSPEQIATGNSKPDRRTDVWSLGATLYECLTGARPFEAPTREQLYRTVLGREPPDLRRINPAISDDLAAIVETALQKDVDRRYRTAAAMADDLAAFREGRPVAAKRVGAIGALSRWSRREPAKALLLLLALVALPTIAALVTTQVSNQRKLETARLAQVEEDRDELVSEGSRELGEGDPEHAIACFERARALEGGSPEAVAGIALAHLRQRRPEQALQCLDANGDVVRGLRAAVMLRATGLKALGRESEAGLLERDAPPPRDSVDFYLLGERLIEEGHGGRAAAFQEALADFRMAIYFSPTPRAIYFQSAAHAANHLKDADTAREMAQALRRHWPRSASCAFWAGFALSVQSRDEAIAAYRAAIDLKPAFPDAHTNLGALQREAGRTDEAIASYRAAVTLEPALVEARFGLALVLAEKGLLDETIATYREVIRLKPAHASAHSNLGLALRRKGLIDEAIACHREAIRLRPDMAEAHGNLSDALHAKGLFDEALASAREAVRLKPTSAIAHANLGVALNKKGLFDEAVASYRTAVKASPDDPYVHALLAAALERKGVFLDEAIASRRAVIRLKPDDTQAHFRLGAAFDLSGRHEDAIPSFREAVRCNPDYAEAWCNLGLDLAKTGRFAEGLEAVRKGHAIGSRQAAWPYPSAQWIADIEVTVRAEQDMLEVAAGKRDAGSAADTLELARLASQTRRWPLALKWYESALDGDAPPPSPVDSWGVQAARAAVQVASANGAESRASAPADAPRMRGRALAWLERVLKDYRDARDAGAGDAENLGRQLRDCLTDPLLAPVRDQAPLSALPSEEAVPWASFWKSVRNAAPPR